MIERDGDPVAAIAKDVAAGVLADAVARAREQAAARLADLITEAIVDEALAAPHAPRPSDASEPEVPPGDAGPGERTEVLYAYGIVRADWQAPDDLAGQVQLVSDGGLGLLVSSVATGDLQVDPDDLSEGGRLAVLARRHDAVVRGAVAGGPVLPLRFGTAVPDEAAGRRLLREHGPAARRGLDRIGDAREWGVRLVRVLPDEPVPARGGRHGITGTEYLARRRQALREQDDAAHDAAHGADVLEETLAPHATDALRRGGSSGSSLLLDMAYLVPPDAEPGFLAAVDQLRAVLAERSLDIETTGAWPPYSFATLDEVGTDGA